MEYVEKGEYMRIPRRQYQAGLTLVGEELIEKIAHFPEHGMGYFLVDVTLFDGTTVEQVPICNGDFVCFYDDMKAFSEADIRSVAPSEV